MSDKHKEYYDDDILDDTSSEYNTEQDNDAKYFADDPDDDYEETEDSDSMYYADEDEIDETLGDYYEDEDENETDEYANMSEQDRLDLEESRSDWLKDKPKKNKKSSGHKEKKATSVIIVAVVAGIICLCAIVNFVVLPAMGKEPLLFGTASSRETETTTMEIVTEVPTEEVTEATTEAPTETSSEETSEAVTEETTEEETTEEIIDNSSYVSAANNSYFDLLNKEYTYLYDYENTTSINSVAMYDIDSDGINELLTAETVYVGEGTYSSSQISLYTYTPDTGLKKLYLVEFASADKGGSVAIFTTSTNNICVCKKSDDGSITVSEYSFSNGKMAAISSTTSYSDKTFTINDNECLKADYDAYIDSINNSANTALLGSIEEGSTVLSNLSNISSQSISVNSAINSLVTNGATLSGNESYSSSDTYMVYDAYDGLALKADADINSERYLMIPDYTEITITETYNGWGKTTYEGTTGWVRLDYVKPLGSVTADLPVTTYDETKSGEISGEIASAKLRVSGTEYSPALATIPSGCTVSIKGDNGEGWYYVDYAGLTGWVYSESITVY